MLNLINTQALGIQICYMVIFIHVMFLDINPLTIEMKKLKEIKISDLDTITILGL